MGYVLNYGAAKSPGQYVYEGGKKGSPVSNDGFKVTATEAKMMARIARGYIFVKSFVNEEWSRLSEDGRELHRNASYENRRIYTPEVSEEFLQKILKFADFAEKSKGFRIH